VYKQQLLNLEESGSGRACVWDSQLSLWACACRSVAVAKLAQPACGCPRQKSSLPLCMARGHAHNAARREHPCQL